MTFQTKVLQELFCMNRKYILAPLQESQILCYCKKLSSFIRNQLWVSQEKCICLTSTEIILALSPQKDNKLGNWYENLETRILFAHYTIMNSKMFPQTIQANQICTNYVGFIRTDHWYLKICYLENIQLESADIECTLRQFVVLIYIHFL